MAFLMLDKVQAPELIAAVIKSSVEPYALENGLDLDQTLLHYIKVRRVHRGAVGIVGVTIK